MPNFSAIIEAPESISSVSLMRSGSRPNPMNNQTDLVPVQQDMTVASVGAMLQAMTAKGVTVDNALALEKMVGLYERMQDRDAEQRFNAAFVALQAEMPRITAKKPVPNGDGTVRYRFAPYEEIMEQVAPLLEKHAFTVTFSTRYEEGRLVKIIALQHGSHKKSFEYAVRIGKGPPGSSETQADGAAATYAKRGALCDALNIVIEHDDDARVDGRPITKEQADSLKKRVRDTGSDEGSFLCFAYRGKAGTFEEIPSSMYPMLDTMLKRKERTT